MRGRPRLFRRARFEPAHVHSAPAWIEAARRIVSRARARGDRMRAQAYNVQSKRGALVGLSLTYTAAPRWSSSLASRSGPNDAQCKAVSPPRLRAFRIGPFLQQKAHGRRGGTIAQALRRPFLQCSSSRRHQRAALVEETSDDVEARTEVGRPLPDNHSGLGSRGTWPPGLAVRQTAAFDRGAMFTAESCSILAPFSSSASSSARRSPRGLLRGGR